MCRWNKASHLLPHVHQGIWQYFKARNFCLQSQSVPGSLYWNFGYNSSLWPLSAWNSLMGRMCQIKSKAGVNFALWKGWVQRPFLGQEYGTIAIGRMMPLALCRLKPHTLKFFWDTSNWPPAVKLWMSGRSQTYSESSLQFCVFTAMRESEIEHRPESKSRHMDSKAI